ncbi:hypothetical protein REPUB_Repub19eG0119700 [Reevesia pubescens]
MKKDEEEEKKKSVAKTKSIALRVSSLEDELINLSDISEIDDELDWLQESSIDCCLGEIQGMGRRQE